MTSTGTFPASSKLHEASPDEGDIVLVGKDNLGIKADSYYLKANSSVIRVMPLTRSDDPAVRIEELNSGSIIILSRALRGESFKSSSYSSDISTLLEVCARFEFEDVARAVLRVGIRHYGHSELRIALVWCSRFNDIASAAAVSVRGCGVRWTTEFSLLPSTFSTAFASQLRPDWVLALSAAETRAHKQHPAANEIQLESFWLTFAGAFVAKLND